MRADVDVAAKQESNKSSRAAAAEQETTGDGKMGLRGQLSFTSIFFFL